MSAPPLIRPPTTRSKFPSLAIPQSSNVGTAMDPDSRIVPIPTIDSDSSTTVNDNNSNIYLQNSNNQNYGSSPSGYFSAEILAAVGGSSVGNTSHYIPQPEIVQSSSYRSVSNSSNKDTSSQNNSLPFPFPVRQSPSMGNLNINTSNSISFTSPSINTSSDSRSVAYISTEQSQIISPPVPHINTPQPQYKVSNVSKFDHLDVDDLGEDDWKEVADAGVIQELGRLGEGAGGSVTRCKLRGGSTVFALKAITSNPNPELQKQILRELQFNRTCNSPHIVKYYGTFLSDEYASIFIAMEYCGGGSLEAIYKRVKARGGRIGEKVLGKIAEGVLSGLSYLHERRIIHRDIKPQNILLDTQGQVKLCDFGVSGEVVNSLATTFTGTSYYMAPERIQGQPYTVTSDVWSLGLTIMEVAQHRFPFLPENHEPLMPIELLTVIVNMPAPELADEPSEGIKWSQAFRHFLVCCLEKNPRNRASPRQMLKHPWIVGQSQKVVKMDKFVRECWM